VMTNGALIPRGDLVISILILITLFLPIG
jgi:hypothetical protein